MARTRTQIVLELKQLRSRLRAAPDDTVASIAMKGIDALLDERNKQRGAHPDSCRCHECWERIRPHLDPQSIADPHEWGRAG